MKTLSLGRQSWFLSPKKESDIMITLRFLFLSLWQRKPYSPLVTPASSNDEEEFLEEVKTL